MRVRSGTVNAIRQCAVRRRDGECRGHRSGFLVSDQSLRVMGTAPRLPPSFTSSYRLFLRASSASVLHHRVGTRYIRALWKPTFREAAAVIHKLQSPTLEISEKEQLEKWRCLWELSGGFKVDILGPNRQS